MCMCHIFQVFNLMSCINIYFLKIEVLYFCNFDGVTRRWKKFGFGTSRLIKLLRDKAGLGPLRFLEKPIATDDKTQ